MRLFQWFCAAALLSAPAAYGQEMAKPGPEHETLKKMEGTWDLVMKHQGGESKGTTTYKMELGGLWLCSSMETDLGGLKFTGKGMDTYDAKKQKFISVWADSMGTQPMFFEGTYDKDKKTLTMTADGPDMTGKTVKWKSVTEFPDADTQNFSMYMGDAKEPAFTVAYKRKK